MIEDTVLQEFRAQRLDMGARVPFTPSGEPVHDSRSVLEDLVYQEERQVRETAAKIERSARMLENSTDLFDVG